MSSTRTGPLPTLIEWDNDVPDFATLADEACGRRPHPCARRQAQRRPDMLAASQTDFAQRLLDPDRPLPPG